MTETTPKPSAKPGPRPGPSKAAAVATPAAAPTSDPKKWGRVTDEGTVYLTTADGEREIGSWQAGDIDEAYAHFGARFDDLATQVALLEARLKASPEEHKSISGNAQTLLDGLPNAKVLGDVDALHKRLTSLLADSVTAADNAEANRQSRRERAIARKEELIAEVEGIAETSTDWKASGDRIRQILEEWRGIRGIDRGTDDALWKRYSRARDSFNRRRGSHFAELDKNRATAKRTKEALVEEAVALQNSTNWGDTASAYRDLMNQWKAAGRAPREADDKLWEQFRAAQDHFFAARNEVNAERDREFAANAEAKEALLAEYDQLIDPSGNLDKARANLRSLQEKWEAIGFVPRDRVREFENRIAELEGRVSDAADSQWRRTDPEAEARVAQFVERAEDFEAKAESFAAKGNTKKADEARATAEQWRQWADTARGTLDSM